MHQIPLRSAVVQTVWIAALGTALLSVVSCGGRSEPSLEAPRHAVLITVDSLRADRLGVYGYAEATTPNFDALSDESIRFDSGCSHSSTTFPSIATLLSGRPPADHGIFNNGGEFPKRLPTLATLLHEADFETAAFIGSYALRPNRELNRGFDSYTQEYLTTEAVRPHPRTTQVASPMRRSPGLRAGIRRTAYSFGSIIKNPMAPTHRPVSGNLPKTTMVSSWNPAPPTPAKGRFQNTSGWGTVGSASMKLDTTAKSLRSTDTSAGSSTPSKQPVFSIAASSC